jgi:signal transduction histidine kinase
LDVGRSLVTELDPESVFDRILAEARTVTGARYAALGVLNEQRTELERFLTLGVDDETHRAIGDLPRGRGVLGVLIDDPRPLRLHDVGMHAQSYGFPAAHPVMRGFLGVPIMIRGQAWGNLYLTEKEGGGAFTDDDVDAAVILADWAATAIENARAYQGAEQRRLQLERAVLGLEAARDIADAIGAESNLERILELIVKRGRALVDAQTVLILLREGDELIVAAQAGHAAAARGHRIPIADSTSGQVLERGRPQRIVDVAGLKISPSQIGLHDVHTALLVPMLYHGSGVGVLAAFDRGEGGGPFSGSDEQTLRTFATSAANAVAINRSVEADRLRSAIAAAEEERRRWARELHDETLQALGSLRVLLASALRRGEEGGPERAMRQAIEDIEREIENLRAIISDLRPSLLDDLGLEPAIEALIERRRQSGLEIINTTSLGPADQQVLPPELETTVYRLLQEALTNIVKHAGATVVHVNIELAGGRVVVGVRDDGVGFDTSSPTPGFGLSGIRERVYLAGGELELTSGSAGTLLRATIPIPLAALPLRASADQLAS